MLRQAPKIRKRIQVLVMRSFFYIMNTNKIIDPSQFLWVSFEMKKEDSLKPYDAKKSVWVPDGEGGFDEALIDTVDGDKVNVKVGWEPKTFKSAQVMQASELSFLEH